MEEENKERSEYLPPPRSLFLKLLNLNIINLDIEHFDKKKYNESEDQYSEDGYGLNACYYPIDEWITTYPTLQDYINKNDKYIELFNINKLPLTEWPLKCKNYLSSYYNDDKHNEIFNLQKEFEELENEYKEKEEKIKKDIRQRWWINFTLNSSEKDWNDMWLKCRFSERIHVYFLIYLLSEDNKEKINPIYLETLKYANSGCGKNNFNESIFTH